MILSVEESLRPPDDAEIKAALAAFVSRARGHYGERLKALYLAGSRARGDHQPHSDVDIAVILADGDWRSWDEAGVLSDLTYDLLVHGGVDVQGVPIPESHWSEPERHPNPSLVRTMRRDGKRLEVVD